MLSFKLIRLLQALNPYELNRFDKFLRSPYFNEDDKLITCFKALLPALKSKDALPEQKAVWKTVYGQARFSNLKFARLYSDLAKKLDEFLVHDGIKQSKAELLRGTVQVYNERKLDRYFPEAWKLAVAKHQAGPHRDAGFYLHQFELEAAHNAYLELQNQRTTEKNIQQTLDALDKYYIINKLNYLAALLHYKKFLSSEGEVALANEILQYLQNHPHADTPAIAINHCIVQSLLQPENEQHFYNLKQLLLQHISLFKKDAGRNFYAFAINFCIRRINFGKLNYVQELFGLYKQMLGSGLMLDEEENLSQFDFKNIVTVALRAGDAQWAEKFIRDYKTNIAKADRQNAYTFNLARLYFHQRKFDKVLPLLQDVVYSDIFYQLDSKTTLMKTYYELGEYLPLMALKESFRILLRRKKIISGQNRINYMNFLHYTMKLYRTDVKDVARVTALEKSITESTNVADKGWLIEKVNELSA